MKASLRYLILPLGLVLAGGALAEPKLQPGLWEYSFDISSKSGQIEAALEQAKKMLQAMPPEQRAMIEQQMAANGISMNLDNYTARVCITPEQASRGYFPQPNDDCEQTSSGNGKDSYKVSFSCEGEPPITGEGEIRLLSEREYRGTVTLNTTMNGQAETLSADQHGQWLAADCGEVPPLP